MACYAAVASLVNLLDDIVHGDRYQHLAGIGTLPNILVPLFVKFKHLQGFLRDHSSNANKAIDDVQSKIRDVAYEAQDTIQYEIHGQIAARMPRKISEDFLKDLPRLEQLIDSLAKDMMAVEDGQTTEESENLEPHPPNASALDPSQADDCTMIGFDEYLLKIKDELCGQSSQLLVIPIVGMGGIGKTTLARNTFKDSLIMHHFDYRGWVTITQDCSLYRVLQSLMKCFGMEKLPGKNEVTLKEDIYKFLKGRRYLIVIDDIWSVQAWDDLKWLFPDDRNGSRILLTSRLEEVASYCGGLDSYHQIQFLNKSESWNLLREKVFGREHCPPELENIGKFIAKKCQGLPLAIVLISGVLSKVKTQYHWKEIKKNMAESLSGNHDISNVLSLSYSHLPHHLKACFLYIGRFPEDYEINISRLINLWIAEGFIELSSAHKSLEEVAEECLHNLVKRSLILVTKRKSSGRFKFCVMHDVLRDFCKMQGLREQFFHVKNNMVDNNLRSRSVRRINVHDRSCNWTWNMISESIRSMVWFGNYVQNDRYSGCIFGGCFILLEILDLLGMVLRKFPAEVFQLLHLKYLALRVNDSEISQPGLSKLQNLQTFMYIEERFHLHIMYLSSEIWEMPQLRHLIIREMKLPAPRRVLANGGLRNLQTLSDISNFIFTDDAITMIPNLTKLKVVVNDERDVLERVHDGFNIFPRHERETDKWNYYGLYNLVHLHKLEKLSITMRYTYPESLPANFTFPLSLKKLCLCGTYLPWKDLRVVGLLPNLQVLKLRGGMSQGEWEPVEGEFLHLKFLLMENLRLKRWLADSTHFPCLERLSIRYCDNLIEIPLEIGNIPTLRSIDIFRCSKGVTESALQIHQEQESMGYDVQVHI